jgi:heme/copper-type cytochrome/quinol oxidase subunit 2
LSFLDGALELMTHMAEFHDHVMAILVVILTLVGYLMIVVMIRGFTRKVTLEHQLIEVLWTVVPGVVLIFIALPSLEILYWTDNVKNARMALKAIGHQ